MVRRLLTTALVLSAVAMAQDSSSSMDVYSSGFLSLPDTLSVELQNAAEDGFWGGFKIASFVMVGSGMISLFLHLINRGAGR